MCLCMYRYVLCLVIPVATTMGAGPETWTEKTKPLGVCVKGGVVRLGLKQQTQTGCQVGRVLSPLSVVTYVECKR